MEHRWRFFHDDDAWRWHRVSLTGVIQAESETGFDTLDACVVDANANGYPIAPTRYARTGALQRRDNA